MRNVRTAFVLAALIIAPSVAPAQDFPTRPITLVVATAPGGGNDILARVIGERMGRILGQQFVIENRVGAGGATGTRQIAQSTPDGYTLGMGNTGTLAMIPAVNANAGYDPAKDFAPIGMIAASPMVVVVNATLPVKSLGELVALAKAEPGKLTYGSGGVGTPNHLAGELFANAAGVQITHVPFRGAAPAVAGVVGNHVSMIFSSFPPILSNVRGGMLRALAVADPKKSTFIPELPTVVEAGLPQFEATQRYGLIAPAGTPAPVVARLNAALREALSDSAVLERIAGEGAEPTPGSPADYAALIGKEIGVWGKVAAEAAARAK